ncbi:hypothetical protein [Hyalangium gracile]|uniref:hypothetical protein n=1 Tax=Hyalangium gracile TaxID=394092 RepID=UPI001CD02E85|nr:hypothetical protein [Hyalangium gracile]
MGGRLGDPAQPHALQHRRHLAQRVHGAGVLLRVPGRPAAERGREGARLEEQDLEGVFTIRHVRFGIEICNDYRQRNFGDYYDQHFGGQQGVDVHLLPTHSVNVKTVNHDGRLGANGTPIRFTHSRSRQRAPLDVDHSVYVQRTGVLRGAAPAHAANGPFEQFVAFTELLLPP